ncbi:phenylalanine--tRNA ligase subunit beta [Arenicellales bacterium nBUS_48]
MIISENWLREWVDFDASFEDLPKLLTQVGLEAGAVSVVPALPKGIVAARVDLVAPHPDADGLSVCQVDGGCEEQYQIVCGAENVREGMITALATPDTVLPNGQKISSQDLRGVMSDGMLCSGNELGLEDQSSGILELDPDLSPGRMLDEQFQLPDRLFEVELTPNRGDCLSIFGVARETATVTHGTLKEPTIKKVEPESKETRSITLDNPDDCPRYVGRVLGGVSPNTRSPDIIRERLRRSDIRSVDALVDITNYLMLEIGQPMHAFDNDRLKGGITVRRASPSEQLILLDGQKLTLGENNLVIADDSGPIALGGIKGGESTMISEHTSSLFLEAASFSPDSIAQTARQFNVNSDAAHRFERGVDFNLPALAIERASAMVIKLCGGTPGPLIDQTNLGSLPERRAIILRQARLERMLGTRLSTQAVDSAFEAAHFDFASVDAGWSVTPPSHRYDLTGEHDLIEEVARLVGYDQFESHPPRVRAGSQLAPENILDLDRAKNLLVDLGYFEAITYSFVSSELQGLVSGGEKAIVLKNPIAAHFSEMRLTLLPGLLSALTNNARRQVRDIRLFETGHVFQGTLRQRKERQYVGGVITGSATGTRWDQGDREVDFFDVKGHVESLMSGACSGKSLRFVESQHPAYQSGQCAEIFLDETRVGQMGRISHEVLTHQDLDQPVYAFEINFGLIQEIKIPSYMSTSRFPSLSRDLSFIFPYEAPSQTIIDAIRQSAGDLLISLELIDLYKEKPETSTKKSLTFRLTLQSNSRNLKDEDADTVARSVISHIDAEHDGVLRSN